MSTIEILIYWGKYLIKIVYKWQDLIGAIIGASAAFLLWWFAEKYQQHRKRKQDLYYLHRIIADQINNLMDIRDTIKKFVEEKLHYLIDTPRLEKETQYSVDIAFFPLFSAHPLSDDIHTRSTGSAYVDNKLARAYKTSKDLPHVIDDLRQQFKETLNFNKEISFNKLNPAGEQRNNYLGHLKEYRKVLRSEMLEQNIPTFLKILTEALVSISELREVGLLRWKLKFDTRYRFYLNKSKQKIASEKTFEEIEKYFESKVSEQLKNLDKA